MSERSEGKSSSFKTHSLLTHHSLRNKKVSKRIMRIKIAGIPIEIHSRCLENDVFFLNYLTEEEPLFSIEVSERDMRQMQHDMDIPAKGDRNHIERFLEINAVHRLIAEKMPYYDVLLVHSSALCMDGQAYLFTAPSGTGKSTHAQLWRYTFGDRVWIINDDKPMLRVFQDHIIVYGTPWDGKHHLSKNASAPLEAIFNLSQSKYNHVEAMSKPEAFTTLLKQAYSSNNPDTMRRIMQLEAKITEMASFYRLECNMDPSAALTAYGAVRHAETEYHPNDRERSR